MLGASRSSPYIARLRELDLSTRAFGGLLEARAAGAGCDDLALADDELGGWGLAASRPTLEHRHVLYSFGAITDVALAGFGSAP